MARVVVPGCWHHVTQRGNHQAMVFLTDADRRFYLELLKQYCARFRVRVAGYCLMGNHVHLVAAPAGADGLGKALGRTHNDYARWCNFKRRETGHVWQNRFFSCPLDGPHTWQALQYVERNPVRAGLVARAEHWQWSSAEAHVSGRDPTGLLDLADWGAHGPRPAGAMSLSTASKMRHCWNVCARPPAPAGRWAASRSFRRLKPPRAARCGRGSRGRRPKPAAEPAQLKLGIA